MKIDAFIWNERNIEHIARHNVTPDEAEEVIANNPLVYRSRENKYLSLGCSDSGRFLAVVFKYLKGNTIKVITARDMSEKERRLYRRRRENG